MRIRSLSHLKHRRHAIGVLAALALIVAALGLRPRKPEPELGPEHFESLRPGMTRAEVERRLGSPRNLLRHRAINLLPQSRGRPISADIAPEIPADEFLVREDRPKSAPQPRRADSLDFFPQEAGKDGDQAVWVTREALVAVCFDPDGRLRQKYRSTVHESVPPSIMDWLASRPRMIRHSLGL